MYKHLPTDFLRSMVIIADMESFTKAGEVIGRSQSALSLQMKKLEQTVGQTLFERQGHNFTLSPQGEILVNYARQILALNDHVLNELNPQALRGNIRLGIPSEFATSVLPKVLGSFSRNNPQVSLEVQCDLSSNLRKDFASEGYDVIFTLTLLDQDENSLQHEHAEDFIRYDDLVWVGAKRFNLRQNKEVPLIVAPEGCLYRQQALASLEKMKIPWRIVYTIVDISGIQAALQEGIGVTVLAKTSVPENLYVMPVDPAFPPMAKVGMRLRTKPDLQMPAVDRLVHYIEQALC